MEFWQFLFQNPENTFAQEQNLAGLSMCLYSQPLMFPPMAHLPFAHFP
jgi:hypothetical protein